jgi:hypothetical protein
MKKTGNDQLNSDAAFPEPAANRRVRWDVVLGRLVSGATVVGLLVGVGMVFVLIRGDPSYLVRVGRSPGRVPIGGFARGITAAFLIVCLFLTGRRAVSDAGADLRLLTVIAFLLFVLDVAVRAYIGPMFPAFLTSACLALLLPLVAYADTISDFLYDRRNSVPPFAIGGFSLVCLAARLMWTLFFSP